MSQKNIYDESIIEFVESIEWMQELYNKSKYTQAEGIRDHLAEKLDDLMRMGGNKLNYEPKK